MRLVMVAHSFPRDRSDVAGSFLGRLAHAYLQRGHTVAVVAPADRGRGGRTTVDGVDVLHVRYAAADRETLAYAGDMHRRALSPRGAWTFLRLVRALRAGVMTEARRVDAQLVHAFWWIPGGWSAVRCGLPSVVSLMGTDVVLMRLLPARVLARRVLARAGQVTALSTFLADETRRLLRSPSLPVARVPVPVDADRFSHGAGPGGGGVVYLGRLTRQKRVDLLLDAVRSARLQVPVTIIGDGPSRDELEARARALGLANVRFLGALPDPDVPPLVAAADVAAFPSRSEGLGLAAAEALMLGVPVVATTDGGGVLDLVRDGEGSCIVPPTPEAMGAALIRCLGSGPLRAAAVQAGRRLREQLSPHAVAEQFERIYAALDRGSLVADPDR
jgi:glycosyltransferase involved in cell wall biosynthesis